MVVEQDRRRAKFLPGITVRMADGQPWSLPIPALVEADPEFEATLQAVFESEDVSERLRSELALTILLLSRNYSLAPEEYQLILSFAPDDPALIELQQAVHTIVQESVRILRSRRTSSLDSGPRALRRWLLSSMSEKPERHRFDWPSRLK